MHEFPILINITVALIAAFIGGLIARRLGLPTLVGYLLAGIVIGPFTPGVVSDLHTIEQLAELGIIFLMFGVGLHFSLRDLWTVRGIAVPGALLQMLLATALGWLLTRLWGWSLSAGIVFGLSISIASTVVLLRNLMDQGLLHTTAGRVAVGWLVLEDIATVLILVLLPALSTTTDEPLWQSAGLALLKTVFFAALMLIAGTRVVPWLLARIARLRSKELFIVSIIVITLGTAVGAAWLFGVSLALGAFLAGVVVHESALSHQVEAEVLPFRETFAVLFFVSVGMLVNPGLFLTHPGPIIMLTLLIILGKGLLTIGLGLLFSRSLHTALVIAFGLAQIGEFSFLLGQAAMGLHIFSQEQYSLLLTGALISIALNPLLFKSLPWFEKSLRRLKLPGTTTAKRPGFTLDAVPVEHDHVIIVGYGRVGQNIVHVLGEKGVERLVVELDVARVQELEKLGVPILYGDAANSEIMSHAHISQARAVVVTVPDEGAASIIVATVRMLNPTVPLLVRAQTRPGVRKLLDLGATDVIHPELEGGLAMVRQTFDYLGYDEADIQDYTDAARLDHYEAAPARAGE